MFKEVIGILEEIKSTSSRNEKEDILMRNADNLLLKRVVEATYNPYKVYKIGKKSLKKGSKVSKDDVPMFDNIFIMLDFLSLANGVSNNIKDGVNVFLYNTLNKYAEGEKLSDLYEKMLLKDLKIGATAKTFNKIWPDLIPTFNVMLAKSYSENKKKLKGKHFIVTPKRDGHRAVAIKESDKIALLSREGHPIENCSEIIDEIGRYLPNNYVYDGELLAKISNDIHTRDLFRETSKVARKKGEKEGLIFDVFDMIPLHEFKAGISSENAVERKQRFTESIKDHLDDLNFIQQIPILYYGDDIDMIDKLFEIALENGEEGIMVNIADRMYECKRTDAILKVKCEETCDLRITGVEEGTEGSKYEDMLGKFIVDYKGHVLKVSGMSDKIREDAWKNPDNYIGRIIEVKHGGETSNEQGGISVRHPRFKKFRDDKTEPSYN